MSTPDAGPPNPSPAHDALRFPAGPFRPRASLSERERESLIQEIEALPSLLREVISELPPGALDQPYRPGGWTARQVVHHLADSHLHSYLRFKFGALEDAPRILAYDEAAWAELPDARQGEVEPSLRILEGLHARWAAFLRQLPGEAFQRVILHPEQGEVRLAHNLQLYAWHGRHHLEQVRSVRGPGEGVSGAG